MWTVICCLLTLLYMCFVCARVWYFCVCVIVWTGYVVLFGDTFGDGAYVVGYSVCVSWIDVKFCVWIYFRAFGMIFWHEGKVVYI